MTIRDHFVGTYAAAEQLGVSVRTVQLWVEKGILDAWKTSGGHRRITQASIKRVQDAARLKHVRRQMRVLVVEDDPTIQTYYEALLDIVAPNTEILMTATGYEGLIAFGKHAPDFVITDIDMPIMDGVAMINAILDEATIRPEDIIGVTALTPEQVRQRGEIPKGVRMLPKPLEVRQLMEAVKGTESRLEASL